MDNWLLNPDFDEGSIMADFDCEDFTAITNPACSPSEANPNPNDILSGAWKETFEKLKALQKDQSSDRNTVTLGSGFIINPDDEMPFETNSIIDYNESDFEPDLNDPDNDCPCCYEKFRYRFQVVDHLEQVHNRCPKCQYKFETSEDLRRHKAMKNCGDKSFCEDDDNLSISGDEDTCPVNDLPESKTPEKVAVDPVEEDIDNKDKVWDEIFMMEKQLNLAGRYRTPSSQSIVPPPAAAPAPPPPAPRTPQRNVPLSESLSSKKTSATKTVVETAMKAAQVKIEPQSIDDNSFEFESSKKGPLPKIKPNSLLKKRLRPTLATKVRGRYGRSTMKPTLGPDPKAALQSTPPAVSPIAKDTSNESVDVEAPVTIKEEQVEVDEDLEGELTCNVCELTVEGFMEMEAHAATHTASDTNGVNCVVCDTFLDNMSALSIHEKEKHSLFAYKCGDCNKIFNSQSAFKDHEKFHNNFKQCPMCDKKFLTDERLKRHQELRCQLTDCKCVQCDITFPTIEELRAHKETHGRSVYRCDKCGKEYDQKQSLAVHKMSHTGEEKPFKCKVCGKGFKTYWYYVVHEKCYCKHIDKNVTIHPPHATEASKKKFYQCKICCRVFPHISHLKVHNYIHTGERPYKCGSCGKGFTQKQNLKVHERVHTGEKPYICNDCGFGFKDLGNLRRHQYVHTGEKPHGCDICSKRFTWVESLRRHKRTHLKQRPFECKICKREFVHHGHLRIHELVHKDEKPFQCNICGKAFTMLSSLSIHEHIHLDRKPYPCDMCQRTFMTASALTTHKQSHAQRMANAYRQVGRY